MNRVFCQFFDHWFVLPDHVCFYGIRRIIYQKKQLKVWMGIFKFFIEGRYCCLADFSGICIQPTWLYRENYNETVDSISSRDRKFGVMVMESTDVRRIHSKEKILFCKEWCVYFSYTHRLSKRKRNWHFVCVPLWLCFVKLRTNILGQATCCSLLWFASTTKPEQDYVRLIFYNLEVLYQS